MKEEKNKDKDIDEEVLEEEIYEVESEETSVEDQEGGKETLSEETIEEEKTIADLEVKVEESQQSFLRLQADFNNYKKRSAKEKQDIHKYAAENILESLLPV